MKKIYFSIILSLLLTTLNSCSKKNKHAINDNDTKLSNKALKNESKYHNLKDLCDKQNDAVKCLEYGKKLLKTYTGVGIKYITKSCSMRYENACKFNSKLYRNLKIKIDGTINKTHQYYDLKTECDNKNNCVTCFQFGQLIFLSHYEEGLKYLTKSCLLGCTVACHKSGLINEWNHNPRRN
jgi:hypothetical protein